jgi:ADP-ribosylglycohydrolase
MNPTNTTKPMLSKAEIIDRVKGMIYGQALGDAYGLATEFKTRQWVRENYKTVDLGKDIEVPVIPFPNFVVTDHNARWEQGDWTDDTDQMICIMDMYNAKKQVDKIDFASRLYDWHKNGFPELGDQAGMGIGATIYKVLNHPYFKRFPHEVAEAVTKETGSASNGALMRCCINSAFNITDKAKVEADTIECAKVTHTNPQVLSSCVLMTTVLNDILLHGKFYLDEAIAKALAQFENAELEQEQIKEEIDLFYKTINIPTSLKKYGFDYQPTIGYVYICLKAFLFGAKVKLQSQKMAECFKYYMNLLIAQGGDADTNGAVCGAALGARMGYNNLPQDWLASMPNKSWLDEKVEAFIANIQW